MGQGISLSIPAAWYFTELQCSNNSTYWHSNNSNIGCNKRNTGDGEPKGCEDALQKRKSLIYSVVNKDHKAKEQVCKIIEDDFADACGIVYCGTQADTVEMAFILKEHCVTATYYTMQEWRGGQRMQNALL